ncbi:T9SS type A sorting domain-containing protein [Hymenobacter antarcticus]|uniref:T9SS type A sorting domain-containing protein n=1 Tax=Hymenobacter antarcticus TaxID=486270 RepID=UPI0031F16436
MTSSTAASATNSGAAGYFTPNFTQPGFGAFGVSDQNASTTANVIPVVFADQVFQAGSTGNEVTFQLGQEGQFGFDNNNSVRVGVSLNGGAPVTALTILGPNSNAAPKFAIGQGASASGSYATPNTVTQGTIATSQNPNAGSIANFTVNLPNFTTRTTVGVTITISAARRSIVLISNVIISSDSPLPVELTRFAATAKGQGVTVDWATASEKNSDRFEVQRSATGEAFETVGTVKGQGNTSSTHAYTLVDSRPLAGRSYYRLRQVDTDGTTAYSPVVAVQLRAELAVYPNPSAGIVTLPAALGDVRYRLLNTIGQTLLSGQATGNDQLDLSKLAKGTFFLELTGEAGRTTQRLVRE